MQKLTFSRSIVLLINLLFIAKQSSAYSVDFSAVANNKTDSKIEPELLQQLQDGGKVTMLVELTDVQTIYDSFEKQYQYFATMEERQSALNTAVGEFIANSQKPVIDFLSTESVTARGITFEPISIINLIIVRNGDLELAMNLEKFEEISKISPDGVATGFSF